MERNYARTSLRQSRERNGGQHGTTVVNVRDRQGGRQQIHDVVDVLVVRGAVRVNACREPQHETVELVRNAPQILCRSI